MAFTSTPLIELVADGLVRLSTDPEGEGNFGLGEDDSGTIGLFEKTVAPNVRLPAAFMPRTYHANPTSGNTTGAVALQDSVQCWITSTAFDGVLNVPVMVVKTGTTPLDFVITLTNTSAGEGVGGSEFEVYIRFH